MADVEQKNRDQRDIDFLLEFREFKGVVNTKLDRALNDIKDLKDGTANKIAILEKRMDDTDKRIQTLNGKINTNAAFYKWLIVIGLLLVGLMSWHILGYKIGGV